MPKKSKHHTIGRPVSETPTPPKRNILLALSPELVNALDALTIKGRSEFIERILRERKDIQAQLQRQQEQKKP